MARKTVKYTEYNKETFVNPYNFVPIDFGKQSRKSIDELDSNRITGVISCKIKTKTPIAIPDMERAYAEKIEEIVKGRKKQFLHMHYPFMKNGNGDYIINGSSIRGMVRNVYETMTDSCFATMSTNSMLTRRNASTNAYDAGVLMKKGNDWCLYRAEKYPFKVKALYDKGRKEKYVDVDGNKLYSGSKVCFQSKNTKNGRKVVSKIYPYAEKKSGSMQGILVIGESIYGKKSEGIFVTEEKIESDCEKVKKAIRGLEATHEIYNNPAINKTANHYGYPAYRRMKNEGVIPIYYNNKNEKLTLSFAEIGRVAYEKTLNQLVQEKQPCKNRDNLCPACTLFGMVGNEALGSRIRFTEAECTTPEKIGEEFTLTELAQPRTSYMPFYSNVTNADYAKRNIPGYDDDGREIRGRKFYWHSTNFGELNSNVKKTERNSTVQVAEPEAEFEFKIYFDSITEEELYKLIYALNFGENVQDGNMCHKIGHGKPIGLGSVKVYVSELEIRNFDGTEYEIKKYKGSDWTTKPEDIDFETETIRSLLKICDFKSSYDVSYPYVVDKLGQKYAGTDDNSLAAHKWFTENTSSKLGGRNRNVQILPKILSFTQELKPYQADIYVKKESEKYVIGNVYLGVVIGYNVKKTSAQIKLNNGGKVSLFFKNVPKAEYGEIDKVLPKNKRVEVVYCGNIDGRDNWKMR